MNTQVIAADIVSRLDALRQDSRQNAADTLAHMLDREVQPLRDEIQCLRSEVDGLAIKLAMRTAELEGALNAVKNFCNR